MLSEVEMTFRMPYPTKDLNNNSKIPASAIANTLLKKLSAAKAYEYGYFLAVTKLIEIGREEDNKLFPERVLYIIRFKCRMFKPVNGEIMTGIVHKINSGGVFLKTGPMYLVFLSARAMPNYHFVPGEKGVFVSDDLSKIEVGVVIRYMVMAVKWEEDRWRDFRVVVTINGDGLGPVSSNGLDGLDL